MMASFLKLTKSNQEQAVASWINFLNQLRLNELTQKLETQDSNLHAALDTLNHTMSTIEHDIIHNGLGRGGKRGMHGFIAEIAECGIGNARSEILGKAPKYVWINDNGQSDLIIDHVQYQQKFVNSGNHLSLQAIQNHLKEYPDYLIQGNKYQIPRDHYEKVKYYLSISKEEADKMPTQTGEFSLKQWKEVHIFFEKGDIPLDKIEPSHLQYKEVQAETINNTINNEKKTIKKIDKTIKNKAYGDSIPTLSEATRASIVSAGIEGSTAFVLSVIELRKKGKRVSDFTEEDWKSIVYSTGVSTVKGGVRGISIYALTNYTVTPAAVASSIVSASFGIAEQANLLRNKSINESEFLLNSEILCLETTVSALSSFVGQTVIPIPILGAVIGNTLGTVMYQATRNGLSRYEQKLITSYINEIELNNQRLDAQYQRTIKLLKQDLSQYFTLLDRAFAEDYSVALDGSVQLALSIGINKDNLLKNIDEIDSYFS